MEWKWNRKKARQVSDSCGTACSVLKPLKYGCDSLARYYTEMLLAHP